MFVRVKTLVHNAQNLSGLMFDRANVRCSPVFVPDSKQTTPLVPQSKAEEVAETVGDVVFPGLSTEQAIVVSLIAEFTATKGWYCTLPRIRNGMPAMFPLPNAPIELGPPGPTPAPYFHIAGQDRTTPLQDQLHLEYPEMDQVSRDNAVMTIRWQSIACRGCTVCTLTQRGDTSRQKVSEPSSRQPDQASTQPPSAVWTGNCVPSIFDNPKSYNLSQLARTSARVPIVLGLSLPYLL